MKKLLSLAGIIAIAMACTKEIGTNEQLAPTPEGALRGTIEQAFSDDAIKAYFNSDFKFSWKSGDRISVLTSNGAKPYLLSTGAGTTSGTFAGTLDVGETRGNTLAFPNSFVSAISSSSVSIDLPATYNYGSPFVLGIEGDAALVLPCWARIVDNAFTMKHLGGYFVFEIGQIPAGTDKFVFSVTNGKRINGTYTADLTQEKPQFVAEETSESEKCAVKINFTASNEVTKRCFIIPVPVGSYTYEWTLLAGTTPKGFGAQTTEVEVSRGQIKGKRTNCSTIGGEEPEPTIPNNEIWYTSADGQTITPRNSNNFGANIVSNEYIDGKGIIKFDGDVTSIGIQGFYYSRLTSIIIPNSVTSIGQEAFSGCSMLSSIVLGSSITKFGYNVFNGCNRLPVENNIRYADTYLIEAVDKDINSYAIKRGTKWIGANAFKQCTNLISIDIPDSVTSIGFSAFYGCSNLVTVVIPSSITTIEDQAFLNCSSLTTVEIPNSVSEIGYRSFGMCSSLTSVTIPNSVTKIGEGAFSNCAQLDSFFDKYASDNHQCLVVDGILNSVASFRLTSFEVPNYVTKIGDYAFQGCANLISVNIANSVTMIGESAFNNCRNLSSVEIPISVSEIGNYAFFYCTYLTSLYSKPTTPPSLGVMAFDYTSNNLTIYDPSLSVINYQETMNWRDYAPKIVGRDL